MTPRDAMRRTHSRNAGFTLIEALIASAVLSFVVAALTQAIVAGQTQTQYALHAGRAVQLAEAMLEEVLSKPWTDPAGGSGLGPESGENARADFDDLDDYAGFTEDAGSLSDATGTPYADAFQSFERSVAVTSQNVDHATLGRRSGKLIVVSVAEPGGRAWTVRRFVAESAAAHSGGEGDG